MIDEILSDLNSDMDKKIDSLKYQLTKLRTGRASASILDGISVEYYGTLTPLNQLGQVSTPEARLLQIQPFDKSIISDIEKAILSSNIGLTPANDGNLIRIPFPSLTEERRKDQVKQLKKLAEDSRVNIRNLRREKNDVAKKLEKDKEISEDDLKKYCAEIQTVTDKFIKEVDKIIESKEKEILEV